MGEKAETNLFEAIFAKRQLLYLWASIKAAFVSFFPLIVGIIIVLSFGYRLEHLQDVHKEAQIGLFAFLLMALVFLSFYLVIRFSFANVFASLDKGTRLQNSWELTKGNWWLIFLSSIVVGLIVGTIGLGVIGVGVAIFLGLAYVIGGFSLYIGMFVYEFVYLLLLMPMLAVIAYLFRVLSGEWDNNETQQKTIISQ